MSVSLVDGRQLYEQGLICEQSGDFAAAFEAYRRSAKANPRVAAPYVGLSRMLLQNHQRTEAIACLERATHCEPGNPAVHTLLGRALAQDGQLERSQHSFEQALQLNPEALDAVIGLAGVFEDLGERSRAAATYSHLLKHVPDNPEGLAGLLAVAEGETLAVAIEDSQAAMLHAQDRDAALIGYALGKVLARRGEHEAAFTAWTQANSARRRVAGTFDRDTFDRRIQRLIDIFCSDFFASRRNWGVASTRPVFVVGLPRSGTTLTEQILSSHPSVFGAGELDLLTDLATATPDRLGRNDPPWPETASHLTETLVGDIAQDHLSRLTALAPESTTHVIDKQPLNFWHLGLVALTLPNAKIIHCQRDIRDNGLSIFAENFNPEQRWATDLADLAYYWQGYKRLMQHWQEVTGLDILEVNYEDTVANLEDQARRLTNFLDLPWDDVVMTFHQTDRAVQTPSRWQVRRPLYASSAGRWRHYEQQLAPLSEAREQAL